jgi:enoyl-CoA hydratase/carnithine racemase
VTRLRLDLDGDQAGLAVLSLTNPDKRNTQDPELWSALEQVGRDLPGNVRVVVVRGEGKSFSAGLDLSQVSLLAELGQAPDLEERIEGFQRAFTWLMRPDLISIAAVQGHAIGAGFQLALACDLRIATEGTVFALPEPTMGIVPDLTGTHPLVAAVGLPRALEWCLTGRKVSADEALQAGLLNAVVPADELESRAQALASAVLACGRDAAIETKVLLRGAASREPEAQWKAEREAQARLLRTLTSKDADGSHSQP